MPFITGSQPWLKPYMLATLAHPPNPPSLNAHYLQALSPISSRRELTVYDGQFIIPAVLSQSAASLLDADEDDTGVTTRNLLGHVLAPVSVIVVPDMTTSPPTATLLIKHIRVFADRVHQRPVGRIPLVYNDPQVCDALRAIVGRQLASYATATVLERADRASEIQTQQQPEIDTFVEELLHDPSIPPSGLLSDSENFAMHTRRGTVVGGGVTGDDDQDALAIIPENPTPPDAHQPKKTPENATPAGSQPNQRDPDWDINFTQDPAEGGGSQSVPADALPQTQHFAIDDDDDADDDDDDNDDDDDDNNDNNENKGDNVDADQSEVAGRKSLGDQRIHDIIGNAQEDTLDAQQSSPAAKRGAEHGDTSPQKERSPNDKNAVTPPRSTTKESERNAGEDIQKKMNRPQKRTRRFETRSRSGKITEKEESTNPLDSRSNRSTGSGEAAEQATIGKDIQHNKPSKSSKTLTKDTHNTDGKSQESPARITRSTARNLAAGSPQRKGTDKKRTNKPEFVKRRKQETENVSPRRSPRHLEVKTPPRRRLNSDKPAWEPSEDEPDPSLGSPVRRSPRVRQQQSPLTRSRARRTSPRVSSFMLKEPGYKEDEDEVKEDEEGDAMLPDPAMETATEKDTGNEEEQQKTKDKKENGIGKESLRNSKSVPSPEANRPEAGVPVNAERVERGTKRKALERSSPDDTGSNKRQEEEEPSSYSPEPFLDKIKAEIEEMKRFRDRIDRNPDGYKTYPDGFLPSARPANRRVQRILKFPPPPQKVNRVLDVSESAPM